MKKNHQGNSYKKHLDWSQVDRYLQAGCTQKAIAAAVGYDSNWLRQRCLQDNGIEWAEYAAKQRDHGDALLYLKVFECAMRGNTPILLKLAAIRLGMVESESRVEAANQEVITIDHDRIQMQYRMEEMEEKLKEIVKENEELKEIIKKRNAEYQQS